MARQLSRGELNLAAQGNRGGDENRQASRPGASVVACVKPSELRASGRAGDSARRLDEYVDSRGAKPARDFNRRATERRDPIGHLRLGRALLNRNVDKASAHVAGLAKRAEPPLNGGDPGLGGWILFRQMTKLVVIAEQRVQIVCIGPVRAGLRPRDKKVIHSAGTCSRTHGTSVPKAAVHRLAQLAIQCASLANARLRRSVRKAIHEGPLMPNPVSPNWNRKDSERSVLGRRHTFAARAPPRPGGRHKLGLPVRARRSHCSVLSWWCIRPGIPPRAPHPRPRKAGLASSAHSPCSWCYRRIARDPRRSNSLPRAW